NELYRQMVDSAHAYGIKILMDMVPNHCGGAHWWMKDLPYHDWINRFDEFTRTNNVFSANYDINASEYDRLLSNRGWFDHPMPDMNLENPDLLRYFQQWAIWWIEYANLDGLRVDTYPYIEKIPAANWLKAIRDEYPYINIVGECWTRPASAVAYWQSGSNNRDGFDSNLPSVMDFPTCEAIRQALGGNDNGWGGGLTRVYDAISQDYLYADVNNLLVFLGNHDMDHIADVVLDNDLRRVKLAITMAATMRGILQLYTGDEFGQRSKDLSMGHSGLRQPLVPESKLTPEQADLLNYHRQLLQFRHNEPVLHNGKTMHFIGRDNTYAYFRYTEEGAVFVFLNASEQERSIPWEHYAEMLVRYNPVGKEIFTQSAISVQDEYIVQPISSVVIKLTK
ncbi:MAG TPA: alpha-amylase, partial [Bacteroidales bacterium]|nr:alpha-amylase [Bacteroidales bacterium]